MPAEVRTEVTGNVALLTVSDPARRNAMNLELSARLVDALHAAETDPAVRAVVITGAPPAFCAGGDLRELQAADAATLRAVYGGFAAVASSPLPTIAAVNGAAVGAGLNLALACDLRLAGPAARFEARFLDLGIHPGGGYTWMAHRALGAQGTAALTLFGETLDAEQAQRSGLVWRGYPDDAALLAGARELAGRAAAAPADVVRTTKATMRLTTGLASAADALEIEVRAQAESTRSPAFQKRVAELIDRISSRPAPPGD
jgi:enoyl-CoA hydratase